MKNKYIGHRYVPKIDGEWDKSKPYESLTVVLYQGSSYTSRQNVPVGVEITNDVFWVLTGNYNAQVEQYQQEVTAQLAQNVAKNPIRLYDYGVSTTKTANENTPLIKQALVDAQEQGRPVQFPWTKAGEQIKVNDTLSVDQSGIQIYGYGKQTVIYQEKADATFDLNAKGSSINGVHVIGATSVETIGVRIKADDCTAQRISGDNLSALVFVESSLSDGVAKIVKNAFIDDVESGENVSFTFLVEGSENLTFNNIRGSYRQMASKAPHLIYFSNGPLDVRNVNVTGGNAHAYGGLQSMAFQFKFMIGGQVTDLTADNCVGVLNIVDSENFTVKNVVSSRDTKNDLQYGSLEVDRSTNITIDGLTIRMEKNGKPIRLGGGSVNTRIINPVIESNHTIEGVIGDIDINGKENVIINPVVKNLNSSSIAQASISVFNGSENTIVNPITAGNERGVKLTNGTGHRVLDYHIENLEYINMGGWSRALDVGAATDFVLRPIRSNHNKNRVLAYDDASTGTGSSGVINSVSSGHAVDKFGTWRSYEKSIGISSDVVNAILFVDVGVSDIDISAGIKLSNRESIVARVIDKSNLIGARINQTNNSVELYSRMGGAGESVIETTPFTAQVGRRYHVHLKLFDNIADVFVDGEKVLRGTIPESVMTALSGITNHGVLANSSNGRFDTIVWAKMD